MVEGMSLEQIAELGWDTQLPTTLANAVNALEATVESHALDNLGVDFLKMYIDFKKLEAKTMGEKTEEDRLELFLSIF